MRNDRHRERIEAVNARFRAVGSARLVEVVSDLEEAAEALPAVERERYEACEQSVIDARRRANGHEGLRGIAAEASCG